MCDVGAWLCFSSIEDTACTIGKGVLVLLGGITVFGVVLVLKDIYNHLKSMWTLAYFMEEAKKKYTRKVIRKKGTNDEYTKYIFEIEDMKHDFVKLFSIKNYAKKKEVDEQ